MTKTYAQLRQGLCERIGDWLTGTADGGDKTELQDTELLTLQDTPSAGMWLLMTSGDEDGTIRKVKDFQEDVSTSRLIFNLACTNAIASTNTYELHKYHPHTLLDAVNAARVAIFPEIYNPIEDETLTSHEHVQTYTLPTSLKTGPYEVFLGEWADIGDSDNLLVNNEFNGWTGSQPDDWTTPTYLTLSREADFIEGEDLVKWVADTNADTFEQSLSSPTNYAGQRLTVTIVAYCETASRVRAYLYDGTTASYSSSYHAGGGWQELTVSANMSSAPSEVTAGMAVAAGTALAGYVRQATLSASRERTGRDYDPLRNWEVRTGGTTIYFPYRLRDNRPILVRGRGHLSSVSADTDEMEISDPQTEALYAEAAYYLFREMAMRRPTDNRVYLENLGFWRAEAERMKRRYAMPLFAFHNISPDWGS